MVHFIPPDLRRLSELRVDALCLPVWTDERPLSGTSSLVDWRLAGLLSRLLAAGKLTGAVGETVLIATGGKLPFARIFVVGAGVRADFDDRAQGEWYARAFDTLAKAAVHASAWALPATTNPERAMELFVQHRRRDRTQDEITIVEEPELTRAMQAVIERERRRAQAEPSE